VKGRGSDEGKRNLVTTLKFVAAVVVPAAACLTIVASPVESSAQHSVAGDVLCAIKLDRPTGAEAAQYLGLTGSDQFTLPQVKADVLVLEVFSMYCPICQGEAPNVNRLHQLVESNPAHKGKVKLLGVGIGNTPYEVDVFRGKFQVPFPLVADPDFEVQKSSQQLFRTPTFIVLRKQGAATFGVTKVHVGKIENVEEFLRSITAR
jgi:peroxiredoxin